MTTPRPFLSKVGAVGSTRRCLQEPNRGCLAAPALPSVVREQGSWLPGASKSHGTEGGTSMVASKREVPAFRGLVSGSVQPNRLHSRSSPARGGGDKRSKIIAVGLPKEPSS